MLNAAIGRGCCHCEVGVPIEFIRYRGGTVALCLECVLKWFPGKTVDWWELRHAPFLDHIDEALKRSQEKEKADLMKALQSEDS